MDRRRDTWTYDCATKCVGSNWSNGVTYINAFKTEDKLEPPILKIIQNNII
jgi:hypothetical protein